MDSKLLNGRSDFLTCLPVCQSPVPPDGQSQLPRNNLTVRVEPCSEEGKAINQRGCVASGSRNDLCDDHQLPCPQSELPAENNDEGEWHVVSYRNNRHKRNKHNQHQHIKTAVRPDTRGAVSKGRVASFATAQASTEDTARPRPLVGNRPICLAANVSDRQWQECLRSFDYLGKISDTVFFDSMRRHQKHLQQCGQPGACVDVSKKEFAQFQKIMMHGPESITPQDIFFLAAPFKVLLSHCTAAPFIILLSLIFEDVVPGFLRQLHECFINGLTFVNPGSGATLSAIAEQFTVLCRQDERYLERFWWQGLSALHKCNLFTTIAFIFKKSHRLDMVRELNQRCDRLWLVEHFQVVMAEMPQAGSGGWLTWLYQLRSVLRANFYWLEHQFFDVDLQDSESIWIVEFANMIESVMAALGDVEVNPLDKMLVNVLRVMVQWTVYFSYYLNRHLGYNRTIDLLKNLLQRIVPLNALSNLAFELRLRLLEGLLSKCEDLSYKRDSSEFTQAWNQSSSTIECQLAICREFMHSYMPPFRNHARLDQSSRQTLAHLNLQLRESVYWRLCCQLKKTSPQEIQKHVQSFDKIHGEGWRLSPNHAEIGTIELAKWHFLAGDQSKAVDTLLKTPFTNSNLSGQKGQLLARFGAYAPAIDELRRIRALYPGNSTEHRRKRNQLDSQIAMNLLRLYQAKNNNDHLIEAYRLAVDLLGRCEPADRNRFEGVLGYIVNAMKFSGLKFEHFVAQTSVLSFLVTEGSCIKSWQHFSNLLHFRHKAGLTDPGTLSTVIRAVEDTGPIFVKVVQPVRSCSAVF